MTDINTINDFLISTNGDNLVPLLPVNITTKQQAYRTAAWIKTLAIMLPDEDPATEFDDVQQAIRNT
jgi:hypothetical protein